MPDSFRLEEYKMLRAKAQDTTRRMEELERNVIVAGITIFAFSLATFKTDHPYQRVILFFLPLCVSIVGYVRYRWLTLYMKDVNRYAANLETELGGGTPGWLTHYYSENRPYTDDHYRRYRESTWCAIIGFNLLAGFVFAAPLFNW